MEDLPTTSFASDSKSLTPPKSTSFFGREEVFSPSQYLYSPYPFPPPGSWCIIDGAMPIREQSTSEKALQNLCTMLAREMGISEPPIIQRRNVEFFEHQI